MSGSKICKNVSIMPRSRFSRLLFYLYKIESRSLRDRILSMVAKREGGEAFSSTLRDILGRYHNIKIGMYSYGGCFDAQNISAGTVIGRYCSFARNVYVLSGNHPIKKKSLHPFFYNPYFGYVDKLLITRTQLVIGNDVWIGQNAIILPSVLEIGDGAAIGAGSVVAENVPRFAVVAGNPAKLIKFRFSPETMNRIIASQWWEKDIDELKADEVEFAYFLKPLE